MEISRLKKVYMIGVKGVGMTMLAQFMAEKGVKVVGSDTAEKFMTDLVLKKSGVEVIEGFNALNIPNDANLIIYSTAYNSSNNEELAAAVNGKIRYQSYAEALADIFNFHYGVAVCGSHGKTTTTAWLGWVMAQAGKQPNVLVGSRVAQFDGACLTGTSDTLIIEADEYQNKLRYFHPQVVLLNNIDYDHPDYFKTEADYVQVFIEFIKKISSKGLLVTNYDDLMIRKFAAVNCRAKIVSYSIKEEADFVAYDLRHLNGRQYFKVKMRVEPDEILADNSANLEYSDELSDLGDFSISLSGVHNVYNALSVIATCIEMGVELIDIRQHLGTFLGTDRRMEKIGEFNGALIYDDYAHHPAEIKATLVGVRQLFPKNELILVFHPHTFTRTKALLDQFADSFHLVDELIVLDIYGSAREQHGGVSSRDLIEKIEQLRPNGFAPKYIKHIPGLVECEAYLRTRLGKGQVCLLMGAGDVFRIGKNLLK
ncbi:MAG: UDP-N-acetylmuramate--L-alanine ligase [bacterium]